MKMPDVDLSDSPLGQEYVQFRTRCGQVAGSALRASGELETHYDVSSARLLDGQCEPHMVPISDTVASFDVVGVVTHRFEDGVCVITVHGFEFWIEPDECKEQMNIGMSLACRIDKLTLYV